ncbi:16S rRNA (cytosine(967)-C(5))-methyltransferase RsmB [Rhodocaloribacter litoris]|uniref:16S rRNA (cytosine(967)-C(5))-methyltransferase RsmB n=1 Tax=Rhodocaloribacter litoris TaxID=2558931 RepID=UPI001420B5AE|nr:16S rRNA (cytosine(967)-C(5))-methyltransferase RsmB [Rhodocaloribacter litoris]QXD15755.1 16S rRNA (cytosine(967)-C(5))-methyltransferase RsmB [Rhodocaloribacter litoris]GIV60255.1 MAG: ribosomal RNA small subunit methyltransferase B [Rhodothermaceae bacterium]
MAARKRTGRKAAALERTARGRAVRQLDRIEVGGAFAGLVGDDAAGEADPRADRLVTEYVAGVTRWRRRLDFLIAHFYRGPYQKMEPTLRQILRLALYDLLFLGTPAHAAVHEAVELAKAFVRPGAGGLVNGLLRAVLRHRNALPVPQTGDPVEDLAIRASHPTWMVRRWVERFGTAETERLLAWNNARPVFGLRLSSRADRAAVVALLDAHGVAWTPSPYLDDFLRLGQLQPVRAAGLLDNGRCAVQDESAGLVVRLLDPQPGETVLDVCAAPGGKARYAADRMRGQGRLLAFDVNAGRLRLLAEAARGEGLALIETEAVDLRHLANRPDAPRGDRVLLDAPCSGLGVLARRADLRWRRLPEALDELIRLQDELLDAAARLVRPGGLLVYATCTIEPEENEARIAAFLKRHPDFTLEPAHPFVPGALVTSEGFFASLPHRHEIDGAFGARLRRAG